MPPREEDSAFRAPSEKLEQQPKQAAPVPHKTTQLLAMDLGRDKDALRQAIVDNVLSMWEDQGLYQDMPEIRNEILKGVVETKLQTLREEKAKLLQEKQQPLSRNFFQNSMSSIAEEDEEEESSLEEEGVSAPGLKAHLAQEDPVKDKGETEVESTTCQEETSLEEDDDTSNEGEKSSAVKQGDKETSSRTGEVQSTTTSIQQQSQGEHPSDLRFSHVDIIVDDLNAFLNKWCIRLGFVHSKTQTWGGPDEPTWSEFAFVFNRHNGELMFMVVEGKHGTHVDLLRKYGSGAIYRLCFKTDRLETTFDQLQAQGTVLTNLEGEEFRSFQDVVDSGKRILWLEKDEATPELSMEILTAPIIDAGCEKLRREVGFQPSKQSQLLDWDDDTRRQVKMGFLALGAAFFAGFLFGRVHRR